MHDQRMQNLWTSGRLSSYGIPKKLSIRRRRETTGVISQQRLVDCDANCRVENLMIFRKHKNLDHGRKKGQPSTTFVQGFEIDPFGPRQQSFSWEGPGSLPGCYSKPPVCPRLSLPPVVAAPMTPLIEATDKLSELRMGPEDQRCSEDAMDTSNLNGGGFGALQPPITCTWADLPVTPKNKKTWPEFGEEIPCQAFKSRPILHFGSPGKIKRPRPASNSP